MKILISPDSFKGSASAAKIADLIEKLIISSGLKDIETEKLPLADGGEGSLDSISQTTDFEKVYVMVFNPLMKEIEAYYLIDRIKNTAYVELAMASGLMVSSGPNNIMVASTYGTGQLIKHAITEGANNIVLFLGGSGTCDAGLGICEALSVDFLDSDGIKIFPYPHKLKDITCIDNSKSILKTGDIIIKQAVDVDNPFYGINGASYIYSPQKGANPLQVKQLDRGLEHLAGIFHRQFGIDLQTISGSGSAGGAAGGLHVLLEAQITNGSEKIFELLNIEEKIKQVDLVISGEGKIDQQTLNNKLLFSLSKLSRRNKKPLWAVCGLFDGNSELLNKLNIERIFTLASTKDEIEDSIKNVEKVFERISGKIVNALKVIDNGH